MNGLLLVSLVIGPRSSHCGESMNFTIKNFENGVKTSAEFRTAPLLLVVMRI
jgi:hypothetical protein